MMWMLIEASDIKKVVHSLALVPIVVRDAARDQLPASSRAATRAAWRRPSSSTGSPRSSTASAPRPACRRSPGSACANLAAHAQTSLMRSEHSVEHELAADHDDGRLRDDGLVAPFTLEATLHAKDLATASEILLDRRAIASCCRDPSRRTSASRSRTTSSHQLFIAIDLVSIVPPIDTARIEAEMFERIVRATPTRSPAPQAPRSKLLDHIARKYVLNRARGWSDDTVTDATQHDPEFDFGAFGFTWRALTLLLTDDIDKVDLGPDRRRSTGVGLAALQAPRNGALAGRTFVIVIYGKVAADYFMSALSFGVRSAAGSAHTTDWRSTMIVTPSAFASLSTSGCACFNRSCISCLALAGEILLELLQRALQAP